MIGRISRRSRVVGLVGVVRGGDGATDERPGGRAGAVGGRWRGVGYGGDGVAQRLDRPVRGGVPGSASSTTSTWATASPAVAGPGRGDTGYRAGGVRVTAGAAAGVVITATGWVLPAGKARARVSRPGHRLGLDPELFGLGQAGADAEPTEGEAGEQQGGERRDRHRAAFTAAPSRPQSRPSRTGPPTRGTNGQNSPRPKSTSTAGSTNSGREHGEDHTGGAGHRRAPGWSPAPKQQREYAEHDGAAAGEDGLGGAAQGGAHRREPVLLAAQLLPVAGDEQQGVVGGGAEDQHAGDAGDLALLEVDADGRDDGVHGAQGELLGRRRPRPAARSTGTGCGR